MAGHNTGSWLINFWWLAIFSRLLQGQAVTVTSTVTQVSLVTVTESVVAIGGLIQNIAVYLDNGNGQTWDYTTRLVTGERVLTIPTITHSDCATVYVSGSVTLTTESTFIVTGLKLNGAIPGKISTATADSEESWRPFQDRAELDSIMSQFVMAQSDLCHITVDPHDPVVLRID